MARHKWEEIRARMNPERRARNEAATQQMLADMPLQELRRARKLSQQTIAHVMGTSQPEISSLERRADTYVSTLRSYVEAMGGKLDIVARFPDGAVRINQFENIGEAEAGQEDVLEA